MVNSLQDNHEIKIHNWMVSELKLKANELIIYAIIHNHKEENSLGYYGGITLLEKLTGASRNTVISVLKNLVDKGHVTRLEFNSKNVNRVLYDCVERIEFEDIDVFYR